MSERIHDLPQGERPREKLALLGPGALSNAELMALFIASGSKGRSAIDIGSELISKYGSMGALGAMPVAELAKEKGLGLAKASKLAAAFELGVRVAREQTQSAILDTPERIFEYFGPQMAHLESGFSSTSVPKWPTCRRSRWSSCRWTPGSGIWALRWSRSGQSTKAALIPAKFSGQ